MCLRAGIRHSRAQLRVSVGDFAQSPGSMRVRVVIKETSLREHTIDEEKLTGMDIITAEEDANGTKIERQCNMRYNETLLPMTVLLDQVQQHVITYTRKVSQHVSKRTQEDMKVATCMKLQTLVFASFHMVWHKTDKHFPANVFGRPGFL